MKIFQAIAFSAIGVFFAHAAANAEETATSKRIRVAMTCFSTGEQVSGMNKICYYDCLGSQAAITVNSVSLCPLSISR